MRVGKSGNAHVDVDLKEEGGYLKKNQNKQISNYFIFLHPFGCTLTPTQTNCYCKNLVLSHHVWALCDFLVSQDQVCMCFPVFHALLCSWVIPAMIC